MNSSVAVLFVSEITLPFSSSLTFRLKLYTHLALIERDHLRAVGEPKNLAVLQNVVGKGDQIYGSDSFAACSISATTLLGCDRKIA